MIVANDPYHGGGHLPDFNVFAPVFDPDGRLAAHRVDPVPPRRHRRRDGRRLQRVRQGHLVGGHALPAAEDHRRGQGTPRRRADHAGQQPARRLRRRPARPGRRRAARRRAASPRSSTQYGADTVEAAVDWTIDDAHRRFSAEIAAWPDGTYEADVYVDSDPAGNRDIHVHVAITVDGDQLDRRLRRLRHPARDPGVVDVRQHPRLHHRPAGVSLVDPSIPKNEGFFDCIDLRVPLGCCLNPTSRASRCRSGTHHPGVEVGDAIALAMCADPPRPVLRRRPTSTAAPARCGATSTRAPASRSSTTAARSTPAGSTRCGASTGGARSSRRTATSSRRRPRSTRRCSRTSCGAATTSPTPAAPGSGAAAAASHFVKEVRTPTYVNQYVVNQRHTHPGIAGGQQRLARRVHLGRRRRRADRGRPVGRGRQARDRRAARVPVRRRRRLGRPAARDPQAVLDDVWDEYVSVEGARARLRRRHHRVPRGHDARPRSRERHRRPRHENGRHAWTTSA